jgi:HTH-type transcriptional regulator/antitoxin HigA
MAKTFKAAESFHPGEYLGDELKERGWSQLKFAKIIGRPVQVVNEIINGKRGITAPTAKAIGLAFGTGAEVWMNLQVAYDLHRAADPDPAIAKRAKQAAA